jgi:hypothetical protein
VGAGAVPSKFADPNIARSQALAPVDRETLLQTTNKATDHRHTDGAHHRHETVRVVVSLDDESPRNGRHLE